MLRPSSFFTICLLSYRFVRNLCASSKFLYSYWAVSESACREQLSFSSDLLWEDARTQGLWLRWGRWNPEYRLWQSDGQFWERQDPVSVWVLCCHHHIISWIWRNGQSSWIMMIIVRNGQSKPSAKGAASPQGQGCPRCSCYVYHADQVNILLSFPFPPHLCRLLRPPIMIFSRCFLAKVRL